MSTVKPIDHPSTHWARIDAQTYQRTKTTDNTRSLITYTIQNSRGDGVASLVFRLSSNDPNKKDKALKVCSPIDPKNPSLRIPCSSLSDPNKEGCSIHNEYEKLKILPKSPGLPLPSKAYFPHEPEKGLPACLILHLYDVTFADQALGKLSLRELLGSIEQIATGLKMLHTSLRIFHGDLIALNVMYDVEKQRTDMIDFGLSQKLEDPKLKNIFEMAYEIDVTDAIKMVTPLMTKYLTQLTPELQELVHKAFNSTTASELLQFIQEAIALESY